MRAENVKMLDRRNNKQYKQRDTNNFILIVQNLCCILFCGVYNKFNNNKDLAFDIVVPCHIQLLICYISYS